MLCGLCGHNELTEYDDKVCQACRLYFREQQAKLSSGEVTVGFSRFRSLPFNLGNVCQRCGTKNRVVYYSVDDHTALYYRCLECVEKDNRIEEREKRQEAARRYQAEELTKTCPNCRGQYKRVCMSCNYRFDWNAYQIEIKQKEAAFQAMLIVEKLTAAHLPVAKYGAFVVFLLIGLSAIGAVLLSIVSRR